MQRSNKLKSVPGVGRRDHGNPVGGVGLADAGDGDLEERLVGERRPGPAAAGDADIDGQVGARVEARVQLLPVHRPELRLARVALVHHRRRLRRRQRRRGRARDGGAVQAEEREQCEVQRGAGALLEETHLERLRLRPRVAFLCGRRARENMECPERRGEGYMPGRTHGTGTSPPCGRQLARRRDGRISQRERRHRDGSTPPAPLLRPRKDERGGNGRSGRFLSFVCPGVAISHQGAGLHIRTSYAVMLWQVT